MKKLYSVSGIRLAALLGGPLAFGYLVYRNYKTFGEDIKARNTVLLASGITIVLFGTLLSMPEEWSDKIPNAILPIIQMAIGGAIVKRCQEAEINRHLEEGIAVKLSDWQAAGFAVLWCLVTLLLVFICLLVVELS